MKLPLSMIFAFILLSASQVPTAWSEEISFGFTATVDTISDAANYTQLQPGDEISGVFTFESETAADPSTSTLAVSNYRGAVTDVIIDAGSLQVDGAAAIGFQGISIVESSVQEIYSVFAFFAGVDICPPPLPLGLEFPVFNLLLSANPPSDLVTGLNLPVTPPDVSLADEDSFVTLQGAICNPNFSGNFHILAEVTSLTGGNAMTTDELIEALAELVYEVNVAAGISNALDSKLGTALGALDDTNENNDGAALNSMYAFCNHVEAQRGKKLTDEQADQLIEAANAVIAALDGNAMLCGG